MLSKQLSFRTTGPLPYVQLSTYLLTFAKQVGPLFSSSIFSRLLAIFCIHTGMLSEKLTEAGFDSQAGCHAL